MKRFIIVLFLATIFASCNYFRDIMVGNDYESGIRVQSYYDACCGRCAKRMIYDDFHGKMYVWFIPINFGDYFCSKKANKLVVHYKNRKITRIEECMPVYDTSILRLYIENRNVSEWIDTNINYKNNFIPFNSIDSLLVFNLSKSFPESYGNIDYIRDIKGYCYVGDIAIIKGTHRKNNYKKLKYFNPLEF